MKMTYEDDTLDYARQFRDDGHFITGAIWSIKLTFAPQEKSTALALTESFRRAADTALAASRADFHKAKVIVITTPDTATVSVDVELLRDEKHETLYLTLKRAAGNVLKNVSC